VSWRAEREGAKPASSSGGRDAGRLLHDLEPRRHRRHGFFTPIINAPEVAILGVSRSRMKPVYGMARSCRA
jgi:pyruvate/2-oxoglutarate dehydrogenase complex dihydrolipoamide acyltransferase (E2) component